jgi:integrase
MKRTSSMESAVRDYLSYRRQLGFDLDREGNQLLSFARFADKAGHKNSITEKLAISWARDSRHARPISWARRLGIVRRFAKYRLQFDPKTEVPPSGLFGPASRRLIPHIYSRREIADLLAAASQLTSKNGLRSATYAAFLGLIAAAGLRVSEAIQLKRSDVDLANNLMTIRQTKFQKSRLVPLHPSTTDALRRYAHLRDQKISIPQSDSFFLSARGARLDLRTVEYTFSRLRKQLGWSPRGSYRFPRIQDLRHTFICRRLVTWYRQGVDVDNSILALSTYAGHTQVTDTYWYVTAIPELMAIAARRFERFAKGDGR